MACELLASCTMNSKTVSGEGIGADSTGESVTDSAHAVEPLDEELLAQWTYSTHRYALDSGDSLLIQNSLPRGDRYLRPGPEPGFPEEETIQYGAGIYWSRLKNESGKKIQLDLHYPADSFAISTVPIGYLFGLILPDTMDLRAVQDYNYGMDDLKAYLDSTLHKPTSKHLTLQPWEERTLLTSLVMRVPGGGVVRTEMLLQGGDLFYRVNIGENDPLLIPCGRVHY